MNALKVIVALLGAGLLYNGYVSGKEKNPDDPKPSPIVPDNGDVTIKIVSDTNEPIPGAPGNPAILAASAPIRTILAADPNDAIKMARTSMGFAELIGRNATIKTTAEFQSALMEAFEIVFQRHGFAAKRYPLNAPIQATLVAAFSAVPGAVENNQLAPVPWNAATQTAAIEALRAIGYQSYQAWADGHKRVQGQVLGYDPLDGSTWHDEAAAPPAYLPEPEPAEGPNHVSFSGDY